MATKRKRDEVVDIDPDTQAVIQNPKKARFDLDENKKLKCLKAIIKGYEAIMIALFPISDICKVASKSISVSSGVTSMISSIHNYKRQTAMGLVSNAIKKINAQAFRISYRGTTMPMTLTTLDALWTGITEGQGLQYKKFTLNDPEAWYGTFNPYIDFMGAFNLRLKELRLGHANMPISRTGTSSTQFAVSRYGLDGSHHVLLEGVSYPPERRASMAQSVGPMTAFLTMLRTTGEYRKKWENAVIRDFGHVSCINDIIEVSKTSPRASDMSPLIRCLADLALITTTRQATRMHFPLCMLAKVYNEHENKELGDDFLKFYNTSGAGGFYTYKSACNFDWVIEGNYDQNQAAQVVFHSIMGTYKEDLGVLAGITNVGKWFKREELKDCFTKGTEGAECSFQLVGMRLYSKLSSANQTGMLTSVHPQVSSIPAFSGSRRINVSEDFFAKINATRTTQASGRTIPQLVASLAETVSGLLQDIHDEGKIIESGTTSWFDMAGLGLNVPGTVSNYCAETTGELFLGRK